MGPNHHEEDDLRELSPFERRVSNILLFVYVSAVVSLAAFVYLERLVKWLAT